jgi:hypothetical protein
LRQVVLVPIFPDGLIGHDVFPLEILVLRYYGIHFVGVIQEQLSSDHVRQLPRCIEYIPLAKHPNPYSQCTNVVNVEGNAKQEERG